MTTTPHLTLIGVNVSRLRRAITWATGKPASRSPHVAVPEGSTRSTQQLHEMSPSAIHEALQHDRIVLVDVREPAEYAAERIHGALLFPLSSFDPHALPTEGRTVVLYCGSGRRSVTAVQRCLAAGIPVNTHIRGGIMAWKHAHLPTVTIDPTTGSIRDRH